jgi:hypothetical protein
VLSRAFADKLADPDIFFPSSAGITAAAERAVRYARYDTARWQSLVLSDLYRFEQFPSNDKGVVDYGNEYTVAQSASGFDAVYHQWQSGHYRLQFKATRGWCQVAAEPVATTTSPRESLRREQVVERVRAAVSEIIRHGDKLLELAALELKSQPYGYLVSFKLDIPKRKTLASAMGYHPATSEWLADMTVKTDGHSFVFDIRKLGVGPVIPPNTKAWFRDKPETPPSPRPGPEW